MGKMKNEMKMEWDGMGDTGNGVKQNGGNGEWGENGMGTQRMG